MPAHAILSARAQPQLLRGIALHNGMAKPPPDNAARQKLRGLFESLLELDLSPADAAAASAAWDAYEATWPSTDGPDPGSLGAAAVETDTEPKAQDWKFSAVQLT